MKKMFHEKKNCDESEMIQTTSLMSFIVYSNFDFLVFRCLKNYLSPLICKVLSIFELSEQRSTLILTDVKFV